jgi:hypothetical protein
VTSGGVGLGDDPENNPAKTIEKYYGWDKSLPSSTFFQQELSKLCTKQVRIIII